MPAPGQIKLTNDELKREAYKQYCEHIAKGYPQDAWYFEHPDVSICAETLESYFKREPEKCVPGGVFDPENKKIARCKNMMGWFDVLSGSAKGTNKEANVASLQMIMRNVHGWDKIDREPTKPPQEFDGQLNVIKPGQSLADKSSE